LFNSTSTQKRQFVPNAGEGNWLSRLRIASVIQRILGYLALHDNDAAQFTVKYSSYINAATGYLIE